MVKVHKQPGDQSSYTLPNAIFEVVIQPCTLLDVCTIRFRRKCAASTPLHAIFFQLTSASKKPKMLPQTQGSKRCGLILCTAWNL